MSTYVDFIENMTENRTLANEFKNAIKNFTSEKLVSWFKNHGYMVSIAECSNMIENSKSDHILKGEIGPRIY